MARSRSATTSIRALPSMTGGIASLLDGGHQVGRLRFLAIS
jgi:hypothetical protein